MKKKIVLLLCCMTLAMTACGKGNGEDASQGNQDAAQESQDATQQGDNAQADNTQTEDAQDGTAQTGETDSVIETDQDAAKGPITEDQAMEAIKQYCYANNSDLKEMEDSNDYTIYWDVTTNEKGEIVVLFRSYTGAESRYYIDPETGETYGTELVPGIIDEEQRTEESFNVRDYLGAGATSDGANASASNTNINPDQIAKDVDDNAQKAASLRDELVGANELYNKYDEPRLNAQDQTSMNELSKYGTMVWKSEAESLLKRIQEKDAKAFEEIKTEYDQWEKYVPVMAERMSYLYEDGSIYPMIVAYNEAMRYKEKAYSLASALADINKEEMFGYPDYTRCGYYGDYTTDSYLVITEGMESGSYAILIHIDDTKELRGWGVVEEDAPDTDTYLLFTSDDGTVKGNVGHSALEAALYVTETDYSVVGPEGAYTFPLKH